MKKIALTLISVLVASAAFAGTVISQSQLPAAARSFLVKYFNGQKIKKIEKDQGYHGMKYEVDMFNGAELEFGEDGSWRKFEAAKGQTVPGAVIPAAIATYVKANGGGASVVEISRKRGGYSVKLSNGAKYMLNESGQPYTPSGGRGGKGGKGK